ncbi:MAG: radical SAM protein [Treponema sp.]|nr:radical SAM protein [Treponema sp.]
MNIVIIQPPLVQLNTPYPAGAYLAAFFRTTNTAQAKDSTTWLDLSTELFHHLFSRQGLTLLFAQSKKKALHLADVAERHGDDATAYQLRRYVSSAPLWIDWIDRIVAMVCQLPQSGHEWLHEFVRSAHAPRGNRMEQYLTTLNRDVSIDDGRILASLALADLADYITVAYDEHFSLVRYAERIATSTARYDDVLKSLEAPILTTFYETLLTQQLDSLNLPDDTQFLISVPFPGTFSAAIYTARYIKQHYPQAVTAIGGGYVNTELRCITEKRLFDYIDFISYDRGYGCFLTLYDTVAKKNVLSIHDILDGTAYYKTKYLYHDTIIQELNSDAIYEKKETELTKTLIPDYTGIDFGRSPRMADDTNPMHRIWSDGAWIKAYLAYGCYWHRCLFCDTTLEYVYGFCQTNVTALYKGLQKQAQQTGVYGIHFVDEACPPLALQEFALANCAYPHTADTDKTHKLTYWGNIRFEKTFSRDLADLLSYGGLTGVSAGIEIATGKGLEAIHKGTDIENIVCACAAFKEAGILVHGYMIYGFWNQSEQDLINSMETLRQLFAAGLIDSAFFHKFTLTRHSTVYKEWQEGKHPDLKPIQPDAHQFAENDIHFEGEHKSEKYGSALSTAVESWMHGQYLNKKIQSWFSFKMPAPSIAPDYVQKLIAIYEQKRDTAFSFIPSASSEKNGGRYVWLGGDVIVVSGAGTSGQKQICWHYMQELQYADIPAKKAEEIVSCLHNMSITDGVPLTGKEVIAHIPPTVFKALRGKGICALL